MTQSTPSRPIYQVSGSITLDLPSGETNESSPPDETNERLSQLLSDDLNGVIAVFATGQTANYRDNIGIGTLTREDPSEDTLIFEPITLNVSPDLDNPPSVFFRIFKKEGDGGAMATTSGDGVNLPSVSQTRTSVTVELDLHLGTDANSAEIGELNATLTTISDLELAEVARVGDNSIFVDPDVLENLAEEVKDVRLRRPEAIPTSDQALWVSIRQRTDALQFPQYKAFIDKVFCTTEQNGGSDAVKELRKKQGALKLGLVTTGNVEAYNLLRVATDAFLLLYGCGEVSIDPTAFENDIAAEAGRLGRNETYEGVQSELTDYLTTFLGSDRLPYIKQVVTTNFSDGLQTGTPSDSPFCHGITNPDPCMIELIWSYWHESGMLMQVLNAISLRFQNKSVRKNDPLINLALDPLRPLNNLLWGFVQNEFQRLSLSRRVHEYAHQYGLTLKGRAVPRMQTADSRVHFLEGFHNLLLRASQFFLQDNDTTVISDGFALLNALKEVHILLAQGAHNQYGDLPWTARSEMLSMQYMLARDEMREFLRGRLMVPYQEAWMGQVDVMNKMQGWTDLPINHFRDLGVYGEQLLLSIRLGDWVQTIDQDRAKNWARYWRSEIKSYIHAYQTLTGVDLSATEAQAAQRRTAQPADLIEQRSARLQSGDGASRIPGSVQSETALPRPMRRKPRRR